MKHDQFTSFIVLRARNEQRGESLNAGVVLFAEHGARVCVTQDIQRLKTIHPDFGAINLEGWSQRFEASINKYADKLTVQQMVALLPALCKPFHADAVPGVTVSCGNAESDLKGLMEWQVERQAASIRAKRSPSKKPTRLGIELRQWLKHAKAFSSKIEDMSRHRVVANYPIDPAGDLYADFAMLGDELNLIEVMDLRGMDKLSASTRGEAAVKGITLDEGKAKGRTIAVLAASDYAVAKPAIKLISRYANDVYDLGTIEERERFAGFISQGLQRNDLLLAPAV